MAEVQVANQYPGQWADDLGSLASLTTQTPRVGYDLSSVPMSREAQSAIATSLFSSQIPPYNGG